MPDSLAATATAALLLSVVVPVPLEVTSARLNAPRAYTPFTLHAVAGGGVIVLVRAQVRRQPLLAVGGRAAAAACATTSRSASPVERVRMDSSRKSTGGPGWLGLPFRRSAPPQ